MRKNWVFFYFLVFMSISTFAWATLIQSEIEGTLVQEESSYSLPEGYSTVAYQSIDLDHYSYYTWGLNDFSADSDLSMGVKIVFNDIYNFQIEENWLNVYLFDNNENIINLGWDRVWGDAQSTSLPDWNLYSASYLGTWSYETTTMDVIFTITNEDLLALMQNGGSFGIGIDPDCHYWGGDITVAAPVPEPATILLLGAGLIGFAGIRRRKRF